MGDFLDDYLTYKIIESVSELRRLKKLEKKRKKLIEKRHQMVQEGHELVLEGKRLISLGPSPELDEVLQKMEVSKQQLNDLTQQIDELTNYLYK